MREGARAFVDWFLPAACMSCHTPVEPSRGDFLCLNCRSEIRVLDAPDCPCASLGNPPPSARAACSICRRLPEGPASIRSAFPYSGVVGGLIRTMKYRHAEQAGDALARLTLAGLQGHFHLIRNTQSLDAIVPVPMHWWRRWRRGFNQAEALASGLERLLGVQCRPDFLRRVRCTPPQARRADAQQRLKNVAGAFRVPAAEEVRGKTLLVVDDVMTTGATVASCAAELHKAGAAAVHVVTVARAGSARLGITPMEMTGQTGIEPA